MLASEVMDSAAALVNDAAKELYGYSTQIPYLKIALRKITLKMQNNQISTLKEESAILALPANTRVVTAITSPALPSDLLDLIGVEERLSGSAEMFVPLEQREWEPETLPAEALLVYTWRELELKFVGATTARDIKLQYYKSLATITSENSVIPDENLHDSLACLTGALLARYIVENYQRYNDLMRDFRDSWDDYIQIQVKRNQANPTRRPGYRETQRYGQ